MLPDRLKLHAARLAKSAYSDQALPDEPRR
jgi:hypothetical protein